LSDLWKDKEATELKKRVLLIKLQKNWRFFFNIEATHFS